jgi:Domain of unknown function (DUF4261)
MAVGLAFVLMTEASAMSLSDLQKEISNHWPAISATELRDNEDGPLSFQWDDATVFLQMIKAPFPWSDLEGPCATSILWPKAKDELEDHKAHCLVTIMGELSPMEMSARLTQATAIALAACPNSVGVYWGNSTMVISKPMFRDFAIDVLPQETPYLLWVDFRVGAGNPSGTSGFTTGMEALGHMEFEAENVPESVSDVRDRLHNLVSYLLEQGPVINDGDTIGRDENEKIRVCYEASIYGNKNMVMRLRYEVPAAKAASKPGWKFW